MIETMIEIILSVLAAVPLVIVGVLLVHWAFGGKKENKKMNDQLFETTAYFNALNKSLPRKFR